MSDMEWLRGLADWAGQHPAIVFLLISAGCLIGLVVGGLCTSAHDGDTAADKAIRQRVEANRARRAGRVESNYPPLDDEHATNAGIGS
jgi:hypothetical protein